MNGADASGAVEHDRHGGSHPVVCRGCRKPWPDLYRLTWEMVGMAHLGLYSNADPQYYKNTTQIVPNSRIPDEHWHAVSRQDTNPWDQYHRLKSWADADTGFVRNVRMEKRVGETHWEPVESSPSTDSGASS